MKPRLSLFWLLPVLAVSAGCSKGPLDSPVSARNYTQYAMWKSDIDPSLTDGQRRALADAESEIKLGIQINSGGGGPEGIDAAYFEAIDGRTLRDVLQQGLNPKIDRLELESSAYGKVLDLDATIETREGDLPSADYLKTEIASKRDALQRDRDAIHAAREQLKELQLTTP